MLGFLDLVAVVVDTLNGVAGGRAPRSDGRDFVAGLQHEPRAEQARSRGDVLFGDGRYNEAYTAYNNALRRCRASVAATPLDVAIQLYNTGAAAFEAGRLELAAACGRAALAELAKQDARTRPGIDPSRCRQHVEQLMQHLAAPIEPEQGPGRSARLKPLPATW